MTLVGQEIIYAKLKYKFSILAAMRIREFQEIIFLALSPFKKITSRSKSINLDNNISALGL